MKILHTLISIKDEGTSLCDTIEYEGTICLVPEWIDNPSEGYSKPVRIICMSSFAYMRGPGFYTLKNPIPKCVLDGQIPIELKALFHVVESPEIKVDIRA
jgi:hypothetical protein